MTLPFVLVHGGDFAASCWSEVLPFLPPASIAVDLPGRGSYPADLAGVRFKDWADSVVADMDAAGIERAVCVGHSLGGATLSQLAMHYPERVAGLAFVACPFPAQGGCVGEACLPEIWAAFQQARDAGVAVIPGPGREHAVQMFGNDMGAEQMDRMCSDVVPESLAVFLEPLDLAGLRRGIPTLYVKLMQDRASPPEVQDWAIANICPDDVATIDCGHMAMYTRPRELAAVLVDWAKTK